MIHCPTCSAGLRFEIETQSMRCDSCGNHFDPALFNDTREEAKNAQMFNAHVFVCPSCGAELTTTDETDAVGFCPYCGGASLIYDRARLNWKPDAIIPFQITKEQCKSAYVKAAKKSIFTSKKYRDPALIDSFRGIYMPYWDYIATQKGKYSLGAKGPEKRRGDYLDTEIYQINGEMDLTYNGYTHDAAEAFDDRISEDLSPFDAEMQKPFAPGYLSGFYADVGDVPKETYHEKIKDVLNDMITRELRRNHAIAAAVYGNRWRFYSQKDRIPTEVNDAKRVLYPVWFMSYRRGNDLTYAAVNGQTGKVSADFPVSPLRVLLASLFAAALIFALLVFLPSIQARNALLVSAALLVLGSVAIRAEFKKTMRSNPGFFYEIKPQDKKKRIFSSIDPDSFDRLGIFFRFFFGLAFLIMTPLCFSLSPAFGFFMLIFPILLIVSGIISVKKARDSSGDPLADDRRFSDSMIRNPEAKRYVKGKPLRIILILITCIFAFAVYIADPAYNYLPYAGCFLCAAELFFFMVQHMRFQSDIAHRRPPQFNKKGGDNDAD